MRALLVAAALLSVERVCYVWVWRRPEQFRAVSRVLLTVAFGDPVDALRALFYVFKGIQIAVFAGWCYAFGGSVWPPAASGPWLVLGTMMIAVGQTLNLSVFHRLGDVGVFYGNRFGYEVPWRTAFPFSMLVHPQYVGAVLSIWGLFVVMRFPHGDWFVLPLLETVYYAVGARLER